MKEVISENRLYVQTLRRLIAEETQCTPESGQVLRTLNIVIDQLELGRLHHLHDCFMVARRRIRSVPTQSTARERNVRLRKRLIVIYQSADSADRNRELYELAYVLRILVHILGVAPERTTLLPDRTVGTLRMLMHCIILDGVARFRTEVETKPTRIAA